VSYEICQYFGSLSFLIFATDSATIFVSLKQNNRHELFYTYSLYNNYRALPTVTRIMNLVESNRNYFPESDSTTTIASIFTVKVGEVDGPAGMQTSNRRQALSIDLRRSVERRR